MKESEVIQKMSLFLAAPEYKRGDNSQASLALDGLGVGGGLFRSFMERFEGPFWSESVACEMLDICQGEESIVSVTALCQREFGFPEGYVVLTKYTAGQVVVLDLSKDEVYEVDFESGDTMFFDGDIQARWNGFGSFLLSYFKE